MNVSGSLRAKIRKIKSKACGQAAAHQIEMLARTVALTVSGRSVVAQAVADALTKLPPGPRAGCMCERCFREGV